MVRGKTGFTQLKGKTTKRKSFFLVKTMLLAKGGRKERRSLKTRGGVLTAEGKSYEGSKKGGKLPS